jgi:Ni,Fe-hydrogenase III large subunit
MTLADGARLAGRISGDSTCAYAWAYAMAAEAACGVSPPPRALMLRALMLERERVANHLGDLGALGNDAALAFGFAQFMRLKEDWLRLNGKLFGHRFMMDRIVPGGVALDLEAPGLSSIVEQCDGIGREVKELKKIYDEHAGLQDRFATTGAIDAALARELSLSGLAARATGLRLDDRAAAPATRRRRPGRRWACARPPTSAATSPRAWRCASRRSFESLRLLREIAVGLPDGDLRAELPPLAGTGRASARSRAGAARCWSACLRRRTARLRPRAIRTIPPGRPGRRWSTR